MQVLWGDPPESVLRARLRGQDGSPGGQDPLGECPEEPTWAWSPPRGRVQSLTADQHLEALYAAIAWQSMMLREADIEVLQAGRKVVELRKEVNYFAGQARQPPIYSGEAVQEPVRKQRRMRRGGGEKKRKLCKTQ